MSITVNNTYHTHTLAEITAQTIHADVRQKGNAQTSPPTTMRLPICLHTSCI